MSCTKSWYILDAYWKCAWILSCSLHLTHNIKTGVQFIKSEISYHCYEEASLNARMQRPRPGRSSARGGQCIRQAPPLPGQHPPLITWAMGACLLFLLSEAVNPGSTSSQQPMGHWSPHSPLFCLLSLGSSEQAWTVAKVCKITRKV